jgi:hypothetical protein
MKFPFSFALIFVIAASLTAAPAPSKEALDLLAQASVAFDRNHVSEQHWNWTATEKRQLAGRSGDILQSFPAVTAESIIRSNGDRCNAVVKWGDGLTPYKMLADSDERCRAMDDFRAPFELQELLKSSQAQVLEEWEGGVALSILPDKTRQRSEDPAVRCAASIQAVVRLDLTTHFPQSIEGKVVDGGCEQRAAPVVQYGRAAAAPMRTIFRKGASFRMEFKLQRDKFGNANNSFWVCTNQHYLMPWDADNGLLVYWGRQLPVKAGGHQLVKDIETKAREFGAGSEVRFDDIGQ